MAAREWMKFEALRRYDFARWSRGPEKRGKLKRYGIMERFQLRGARNGTEEE